jgi:putative transposase
MVAGGKRSAAPGSGRGIRAPAGAKDIFAQRLHCSLDKLREDPMSSTHVCLHYHLIFSTKNRRGWIRQSWQLRLFSYLGGILRGSGGVAVTIGGMEDHVHILAGLKSTNRVADVLRDIKSNSSEWIHAVIGCALFEWQEGYGAFTVSRPELETVKQYILRQEDHHRKQTFQEEYLHLLHQNHIEFDEKYLW